MAKRSPEVGASARSQGRPALPSLIASQDRFIATWGQMGSTWGISRTMAEVHALLYIAAEPLCTDDVMERLEISRGNASMSLRALVDWGIVARAHKRGDRKEYFQAEQDPWTILRAVVAERMKREMHPVLAGLTELRDTSAPPAGASSFSLEVPANDAMPADHDPSPTTSQPDSAEVQRQRLDRFNDRLDAMIGVLRGLSELGDQFLAMPIEQLQQTTAMLSGFNNSASPGDAPQRNAATARGTP
jgi:DNA-binding transcriptional regulator GbsR (MarR family)